MHKEAREQSNLRCKFSGEVYLFLEKDCLLAKNSLRVLDCRSVSISPWLGYWVHAATSGLLYVGTGDQTQLLELSRQALYLLTELPSQPQNLFWWYSAYAKSKSPVLDAFKYFNYCYTLLNKFDLKTTEVSKLLTACSLNNKADINYTEQLFFCICIRMSSLADKGHAFFDPICQSFVE